MTHTAALHAERRNYFRAVAQSLIVGAPQSVAPRDLQAWRDSPHGQRVARLFGAIREQSLTSEPVYLEMGFGYETRLLAQAQALAVGFAVYGIELRADAVAAAQQSAALAGAQLCMTVPQTPADVVLWNHPIPALLLNRPLLSQGVAPGGHLVITTDADDERVDYAIGALELPGEWHRIAVTHFPAHLPLFPSEYATFNPRHQTLLWFMRSVLL